jgi:hypothetical protein
MICDWHKSEDTAYSEIPLLEKRETPIFLSVPSILPHSPVFKPREELEFVR